MSRRRWTDEEVQTLTDLWPTTPGKEVAERLHRSLGSVYVKAAELGLRKGAALEHDDEDDDEQAVARRPWMPTNPLERTMRSAADVLIAHGVDEASAHIAVGVIARGQVPNVRMEKAA